MKYKYKIHEIQISFYQEADLLRERPLHEILWGSAAPSCPAHGGCHRSTSQYAIKIFITPVRTSSVYPGLLHTQAATSQYAKKIFITVARTSYTGAVLEHTHPIFFEIFTRPTICVTTVTQDHFYSINATQDHAIPSQVPEPTWQLGNLTLQCHAFSHH